MLLIREFGRFLRIHILMQCIMRRSNIWQINREVHVLTIKDPVVIQIGTTMRTQWRVSIRAILSRVGTKVGKKESGGIGVLIGYTMSDIDISLHMTVLSQKSKPLIPKAFEMKTC